MRPLDVLSCLLLAGAVFVYSYDFGGGSTIAMELPQLSVDSSRGAPEVVCDDDAIQRAFAAAGLPAPPRFNGSDPVTADVVLDRVRSWQETRSPALLGELGMIFLALEENPSALAYLAAARAMSSDVWWTYFLAATVQKMGYREQAVSLLDEFVARESGYGTAFARLGQLHLELGSLDRAETHFTRALELMPGQSLAPLGLGRVALARGNPEQAVQHLSRAVGVANDFIAYRFLSQALMATGREAQARDALRKAETLPQYSGWLQFDPRLERAHEMAQSQRHLENRLRVALGANDLQAAIETLERLIERRPGAPGDRNNLASLFLMARRFPEATQLLDDALELFPEDSSLLFNRARAGFMQGQFEEALQFVERSSDASTVSAPALDLKGRSLYRLGRAEEAIATMERALELDPDNVGTHLALGSMCLEVDRPGCAREAFEAVLRLDPANAQATSLLSRVR